MHIRLLRFTMIVGILYGLVGITGSAKAAQFDTVPERVHVSDPIYIPPSPEKSYPEDITPTAFLPLVNKANRMYPTLPLGGVQLNNGPYVCDPTTNQSCYDLTVTCNQLTQPLGVSLKVGDPSSGAILKGTIMFFSGYTGTYFWEVTAKVKIENGVYVPDEQPGIIAGGNSPDAVNYPQIIQDLRDDGFRTVQVDWADNWFKAESGVEEGMVDLACRPASLIRWVYNNLHGSRPDQPFCADGHSNGASQLAYSLTRYGMAKYLDLAVFESGPNWTYLDQSCIQDDPAYQDIWTPQDGRQNLDLSYGYPANGSGPCGQKLKRYRTTFQNDSVGYGNGQFFYPRTMMAFLFGDLDATPTTRNSGRRFSDLLVANSNPYWSRQDLPNTAHSIGASPEGLIALGTTLSAECKLR